MHLNYSRVGAEIFYDPKFPKEGVITVRLQDFFKADLFYHTHYYVQSK